MEPAIALVLLVVFVLAGARAVKRRSWWAVVPAALVAGWFFYIWATSQP